MPFITILALDIVRLRSIQILQPRLNRRQESNAAELQGDTFRLPFFRNDQSRLFSQSPIRLPVIDTISNQCRTSVYISDRITVQINWFGRRGMRAQECQLVRVCGFWPSSG